MKRGYRARIIRAVAWTCFCTVTVASGQDLGPEAYRFAACERVADARALDELKRSGIGALICLIEPDKQLAILIDDTVSWPQLKDGAGPWVSLENPLAAKAWFPNTSPLRVRFDRDSFVLVPGSEGKPPAIVYSAAASRIDADGSINAFVALRFQPPCLLAVSRDLMDALHAARDRNAACIPAIPGR